MHSKLLPILFLTLAFAARGSAATITFSNTGAITIPASGMASSDIVVTGFSGGITDVSVELRELYSTTPGDLQILLVGPAGEKLILMSGVAADGDIVTGDYNFIEGGQELTTSSISPGSYAPTDFDTVDEGRTSPAPNGTETLVMVFSGLDPNGTWSLDIVDNAGQDGGSLGEGWSLTLTADASGSVTEPPSAATPEPSTLILLGTGILGLAGAARRKFSPYTVNRRTPMRLRLLVAAVVLFGASFYAKADTLIQITSGASQTNFGNWGQSFTIPGSGQFDNITFNFFDSQGNPLADGNGWLFSSPYTFTPGDLSFPIPEQLPNFVAESAPSFGGVYSFLPTLSLSAGTTYYFYEDDPFFQPLGGATYAGGVTVMSPDSFFPFESFPPGFALDFEVTGTPVVGGAPGVTPEPSSLLLFGTGILGIATFSRLRFRRAC